jgi:hypothetical protein
MFSVREGFMHARKFAVAALVAVVLASGGGVSAAADKAPASWDNLVRVSSKRLKYVYLLPGADFRSYTKVMLDPTEVAFAKNWRTDYNRRTGSGGRISDADVQKAVEQGGKSATEIFAKAFNEGGYTVVTTPGPDVLRVRTGIVDLQVDAPDTMSAGRVTSYAQEAGEATLIVEARDSVSGALLGRVADRRVAGDNSHGRRSSVSNRRDFQILAKEWAVICVKGLDTLKSLSPVDAAGRPEK